MKKMLINFAENLISKDQMSKIKGGCGVCYNSEIGYFSAIDDGDAQNTMLELCGPCQYSCTWE